MGYRTGVLVPENTKKQLVDFGTILALLAGLAVQKRAHKGAPI
jgi:hypothetical protein